MQTAPVALSELLRLAFPSGSEFSGTPEQRSRVVQWANVINLPLHDEAEVEEDDLVLLPADAAEPELLAAVAALSQAEVAAAAHIGPLPESVIKAARQALLQRSGARRVRAGGPDVRLAGRPLGAAGGEPRAVREAPRLRPSGRPARRRRTGRRRIRHGPARGGALRRQHVRDDPGRRSYTEAEITAWAEAAGFRKSGSVQASEPSRVLEFTKPK